MSRKSQELSMINLNKYRGSCYRHKKNTKIFSRLSDRGRKITTTAKKQSRNWSKYLRKPKTASIMQLILLNKS